jgi:hypothetical protein
MRRLAAALWLLGAASAWAATAPVLQPTHDVDITYKVPVPGAARTALLQRLRWSASLRRQRLDLPTSGNWMVMDFVTHRMDMVRDDTRSVLDLPAPPDPPPSAAGFAPLGDSSVAGLACEEWRTRDNHGAETIACYTADGILLRARAGDRVLMEAVSVQRVPQADSVFALPQDYTRQEGNR